MLSYRHAYHAGNPADVLKHVVQIECLKHFCKKDKPFWYIDTHAGAGGYTLDSKQANITSEADDGVNKVLELDWPELEDYQTVIGYSNDGTANTRRYPGSPLIAEHWLREQDHARLYELHPADFKTLQGLFAGNKAVQCQQSDGLKGVIADLPPPPRRALVLIDPSYEVKEDYQQVIETLINAHKRFATGTYALWYPVVERARIRKMEAALVDSRIRNIQLFELPTHADRGTRGMTASGMIVINPPWTLMAHMQSLLPKLTDHLTIAKGGNWRAEQLVAE